MMERLTFEGNFCDIAICLETPGGSFCEDGMCSQRKVWERLKHYEDMEEQGRLVVLPCKIGADIYRVGVKEVCDYWQIARAEIYQDEIILEDDSDNVIFIGDFGKTVFLTREEAEQALKGGAN